MIIECIYMKKTNRQSQSKMSSKQANRFIKAQESVEKMLQEIAPYTPKLKAKEVSTAGKWESTTNFNFLSVS